MSINTVVLSGTVGNDLELKTTQGGYKILNFSLAVNKTKKENDKWVKVTDWFSITCWGGKAEYISNFAKKGSKINVHGQLETQVWEKDGKKQYKVIINATEVEITANWKNEQSENIEPQIGSEPSGIEDTDIPF